MNQKQDHICPLCGGPNECALAQNGSPGTPCWCREVTIDSAVLANAHKTLHNESCICKQCAMATVSSSEMPQLIIKLYSTEFCHLCDEAEAVVRKAGFAAIKIDIAEDDVLFEKYGSRIPVLQRVDSDAELGWPFDAETVTRFLR